MAGLGLVAYDGSGSSSEDEEESSVVVSSVVKTSAANLGQEATEKKPALAQSSMMLSKFIDDEEDIEMEGNERDESVEQGDNGINPMWSKLLPQPKKVEVVEEDDVEIGPIPPKKTYGDEELPQPPKQSSIATLSSTKVKGKTRISIPFLNSIDEKEPDEDGEKKRILKPSEKGSGLFAILPQPRNSFGFSGISQKFLKTKTPSDASTSTSSDSSKSLDNAAPAPSTSSNTRKFVPDSVKNNLKRPSQSKLDEIRAKLSKKTPSSSTKPAKDSDSEDDDSGDFFSFNKTESIDEEALEKLKLPMQDFTQKIPEEEPEPMEEEDDYEAAGPSSSRSEDLMKFIQPKRGKKEDIQIIDINADDLRPDNTEWLKNITDESQVPARRSKGLGGMVKRKHQITYLAFEAKAREQELKNQWAQNRMNKMATNNKYGF